MLVSKKITVTVLERKIFKLNEPYRELKPEDAKKPFLNEFFENAGISLAVLVEERCGEKYVWVYDFGGKILAVLSFVDTGFCFYMDVLAKNKMYYDISEDLKPGFSLVRLLEDLSPKFGYRIIRMASVASRVEYWTAQGYRIIGMPAQNERFGQVFPMEKNLI